MKYIRVYHSISTKVEVEPHILVRHTRTQVPIIPRGENLGPVFALWRWISPGKWKKQGPRLRFTMMLLHCYVQHRLVSLTLKVIQDDLKRKLHHVTPFFQNVEMLDLCFIINHKKMIPNAVHFTHTTPANLWQVDLPCFDKPQIMQMGSTFGGWPPAVTCVCVRIIHMYIYIIYIYIIYIYIHIYILCAKLDL